MCGSRSVVGIATGYGLDGPGIEAPWGARFSVRVQTGPVAHPASCTMGTGSFPGVKSGRGVTLAPHHLLVPWSRKSRAVPLLPYRPYGLYRASVPVQYSKYSYTSTPPVGRTACTEPQCLYSTAIPLLPLCAVGPVQSLSACTVQLHPYSPCRPYGLYRAPLPVQGYTLPFHFTTCFGLQTSHLHVDVGNTNRMCSDGSIS